MRDGAEAVRLAAGACRLTQFKQTTLAGTLAAAYAEAGRFPEAVATGQRAYLLAIRAGDKALFARNQQLRPLYRAGKPYPAPTAAASSQPAPLKPAN